VLANALNSGICSLVQPLPSSQYINVKDALHAEFLFVRIIDAYTAINGVVLCLVFVLTWNNGGSKRVLISHFSYAFYGLSTHLRITQRYHKKSLVDGYMVYQIICFDIH
jgi:hypothetical protein